MTADPKPRKAIRDPAVFKKLHAKPGECIGVCGGRVGQSLHHVLPRGVGGDDVEENLVWLCGSGTTGCHGLVENHDPAARRAVGDALPDAIVRYVCGRLGESAGIEYLRRHYFFRPKITVEP